MSFLTSMFKTEKPVIGMLHLRPLPGDPLYYPGGSVSQVVEAAKRDLEALQQGGVDGILITNELSMPYEQHVSPSTLASMGYVIGALSHDLSTPWGAEAIYDGDATIELCAAVEQALFGRDGHGLSDGMVFVNAVVERCRRHDARARRVGVLGCHTGSSRCKSASFHAAIRVPTRCESYVTFNRYHQLINSSPSWWDAVTPGG